jgi:colanic acid biosynthesis glycosyl transferase WcaI
VTLEPLRGKRIAVVGINYAPEHTGIAPYTTATAEHLASCGASVCVLTGVPHYPHWTVPVAYRRAVLPEETRSGVRIRRLRHYVPSSQSAAKRGAYEASFGAQVLRQRLPWQPDLVLAVVPSLLGAAAAARLARRHGAPFAVIVQDLMGHAAEQSGMYGGHAVAGSAGSAEAWVLRQAAAVVVINEAFGAHVVSLGIDDARVHVVRNWSHVAPPTALREKTRADLGWDDGTIVALHSGNMGLKQGLENVVSAARLAHATDAPVRFVLMGDGNQRAVLQALAGSLPSLSFLPSVPSEAFTDTLAAADVLLVNERGSVTDMSLPSKLTSYFVAGRPVVAAVRSGGGTAAEVRRSGGGFVVPPDRPDALLGEVLHIAGDASVLEKCAARASAYAARCLSPDTALAAYEKILTDLVANP